MFTALLDTSVLWPSLQRDFLLSMAVEGAYRPVWSEAILHELAEHEAAKLVRRHGIGRGEAERRAGRLTQAMCAAFADSVVTGWEPLEGSFGLPDEDDEHVAAAAVIGGAGAIVTSNLKDFPRELLPGGIDVLPPAQFALNTVAISPRRALVALDAIASRSGSDGRTTRTVEDILTVLAGRYGMTDAVALLREN